jgi:hypothetical protein
VPGQQEALAGYISSAPPAASSHTDTSIKPQAEGVFLVGARFRGRAQFSGELWLAFNDAYSNYTTDNSGQITAIVNQTGP